MRYNPLVKNNVRIAGKPQATRTIIFAHGFGTDQSAWRFITNAFEDNYRLVLYDNVGAGQALPDAYSPIRYSSLQSYADDMLDICEELELKDAIVVAHSVSGMISLLAAIKAPEFFERLVFIGASPRYLDDEGYVGGFTQADLDGVYEMMTTNYYGWVSGFAPIAMNNPEYPQLAEEVARTLSAIRPDIAQAVSRAIFQSDHRQDLGKLDKPVLIIQADEDVAVPCQVGRYLHEHIRESELREIKARGHFPHMSAPEEVMAAIKAFI